MGAESSLNLESLLRLTPALRARLYRSSQPSGAPDSSGGSGLAIVVSLLSAVALASFAYFCARGEVLLSGDAVAHINIARRIFDSLTPGLFQLGTVWLPLPHLLTVPFIVNDKLWSTGIGGSVISVISYVVAGCGIYRLGARWSRLAAWAGVAVFSANPNLLYVQSTALNEPLYLAAFIWTAVFFSECAEQLRASHPDLATAPLEKGAIALIIAILTRYDGWFLAAVCWVAMLPTVWRAIRGSESAAVNSLRRSAAKALLLTALAPSLWLAYNLGVYKNALEFANGPYSARAIAMRTTASGVQSYPGEHSPRVAAIYFIKTVQLNLGPGWLAKLLLLMAVAGSIAALRSRHWLLVTLLWCPLVFYPLSIAYGAVPIFIPVWWPFSYYNVRYGLELLPAIAVGAALLVHLSGRLGIRLPVQPIVAGLLLAIVAGCYLSAAVAVPVCLREMRANGQARLQYDHELAAVLRTLPATATVLAYTGAHAGAFELAGFHLDRTINEGIYPVWDASLQQPAQAADYVIAEQGDPVSAAVRRHPQNLVAIHSVLVPGQPPAVVYKSGLH